MIEPMKFVSISGPRDDLDRMVNQVLCRYEIHLENALTELKSVSKLIPCPGTNPYREPYEAAEKLAALCSAGTKAAQTPSPASMTAEEACLCPGDKKSHGGSRRRKRSTETKAEGYSRLV